MPRSGADAFVYGAVEWDPDGSGPQPEMVLVYGNFTTIGGVLSPGIAVWSGERYLAWNGPELPPDGRALSRTPFVLALKNGALHAANFTGIFEFSGGEWVLRHPFPARMNSYTPLYSFPGVTALVPTADGWIVAGRRDLRLGDESSPGIIRVENGVWRGFGDGLGTPGFYTIDSIANTADGLFVYGQTLDVPAADAGPSTLNIARWTGTRWVRVPFVPVTSNVFASASRVFANNGRTRAIINNALATWNGTAFQFDELSGFSEASIRSVISLDQDELYANADVRLPRATGRPMASLARISDDELSVVASAIAINSAALVGGARVGGRTTLFGSSGTAFTLEGANSLPIGASSAPFSLFAWRQGIAAFFSSGGPGLNLLTSPSGDPGSWRSLSSFTIPGLAGGIAAYHACAWDGQIALGIDAFLVPVVMFDGQTAARIGPSSGQGSLSGELTDLFTNSGELIAAGRFTLNTVAGVRLARFADGEWRPFAGTPGSNVGAQFTFSEPDQVSGPGPISRVKFHSWNGMLLASGPFTHVNGIESGRLAGYDGTTWRRMDAGLTGTVSRFASDERVLAAAVPSSAFADDTIWTWNANEWLNVSARTQFRSVFGLAIHNGDVHVSAQSHEGVQRLGDGGWEQISPSVGPTGFTRQVGIVASIGGRLYSSASMGAKMPGGLAEAHVYRLTDVPPAPLLTSPVFGTLRGYFEGSSFSFNTPFANTNSFTTYTLVKDGRALVPGVQPSGSVLRSPFSLNGLRRADAGEYVLVANTCGLTASTLPVTIPVFCRGDVNRDGDVSVQDIYYWLNVWLNGGGLTDDPVSTRSTLQDLLNFLNQWFAGCLD